MKAEKILVNINDEVEVRLTRRGMMVYERYAQGFGGRLPPLQIGGGGWIRFQLWQVAHIFGEHMYMGADNVIVDNVIRLPAP